MEREYIRLQEYLLAPSGRELSPTTQDAFVAMRLYECLMGICMRQLNHLHRHNEDETPEISDCMKAINKIQQLYEKLSPLEFINFFPNLHVLNS
jgi:hypothetical protein